MSVLKFINYYPYLRRPALFIAYLRGLPFFSSSVPVIFSSTFLVPRGRRLELFNFVIILKRKKKNPAMLSSNTTEYFRRVSVYGRTKFPSVDFAEITIWYVVVLPSFSNLRLFIKMSLDYLANSEFRGSKLTLRLRNYPFLLCFFKSNIKYTILLVYYIPLIDYNLEY